MQKDTRKTSGDGLDAYIQVSNPGLLIIVGALSLMLIATVVWGFTGKIPVTITVTGCVVDSKIVAEAKAQSGDAGDGLPEGSWIVCFVDSSKYSAEQISKFGSDVAITMPDRTTFKGKIENVSQFPLNRDEARSFLGEGEWVAEQCVTSNYSWGIVIQVSDDVSDHLFTTPQITIVTDEVPPIRFLVR